MPIKCCKDCVPPKRHPGCHSQCPDYLREKAEYEEWKKKERAARMSIGPLSNYEYDEIAYARCKRHKRHRNY